jgi:hypothetical protein
MGGPNILSYKSSKPNACIIAHDAGGAEIISSWINNFKNDYNFTYSIHGPAIEVFKRKIGEFKNQDIEKVVKDSEIVFIGTSWGSEIEIEALRLSKKAKVSRSIAFLDHWVNYRERFTRDQLMLLPDEIWVSDHYAYEIAKNAFPNTIVNQIKNFYLEEIVSKVMEVAKSTNVSQMNKFRILFIGENISANSERTYGNPNHFGYTEQESFLHFLMHVEKFGDLQDIELKIRPHPSESSLKYTSIIPRSLVNKLSYRLSEDTLEIDIGNSNVVVGMSSFALYIAISSGIKTICAIPDLKIPCIIPDLRIKRI